VQLFAVKAKYGTVKQFKEFVKQCHQRGIAVIVDVVYNHLVGNNLLKAFGGVAPASIPNGIYFYGGDRADSRWFNGKDVLPGAELFSAFSGTCG
jgi:1,4-alpha-glucan branching enzyme